MKTMGIKLSTFNLSFLVVLLSLYTFYTGKAQTVGINTATPKSNCEVSGSFGQTVTNVSASTVLDATQSMVVCNNGATPINITMPDPTLCSGRIYTVKRDATASADVTLIGTFDGATNLILTNPGETATVIANGSEWERTGSSYSGYNLMFPMGEVSYFSTTGTTINISGLSNGTTNMVVCNPATTFLNGMSFDNGGSNNGRLRYTGATTKMFHIACTISISPTVGSDEYVFGVAKNGTVLSSSKILQKLTSSDFQSTAMHVMITLATNDYLELFVGNMTTSGRDVNIKSINLFAMGM